MIVGGLGTITQNLKRDYVYVNQRKNRDRLLKSSGTLKRIARKVTCCHSGFTDY